MPNKKPKEKKERPEGHCALCRTYTLLCESHILPEFLYESLYDAEHKFWRFNERREGTVKRARQGIYEYLLCVDCEIKFSEWETYGKEVLFTRTDFEIRPVPGNSAATQFLGIDYVKFKLFLLSVLWRMGVSQHEFFSEVVLGPKHEESLREMLLRGDPGKSFEYGTIISGVTIGKKPLAAYAAAAEWHRIDGMNGFRVAIGGFALWWVVAAHSQNFTRKEYFLSETGELLLTVVRAEDAGFLSESLLSAQKTLRKNKDRLK